MPALTTRLWIEIAGAVILCTAIVSLWIGHNHKERAIGAVACIQSTSATKEVATDRTQAIEIAHATQLAKVVKIYEDRAATDRANAAGLAQRLHDADSLRRRTVPGVVTAAGEVHPGAVDAAPSEREKQYADSLTVCVANADELDAIRAAWILQAAKLPPH